MSSPLLSPSPQIALDVSSGVLGAAVVLSPDAGNALTIHADGLYAEERTWAVLRMYQATVQTLDLDNGTILSFDSVAYDSDGMYESPTAAMTRTDGLYHVQAQVGFSIATLLGIGIQVLLDGAVVAQRHVAATVTVGPTMYVDAVAVLPCYGDSSRRIQARVFCQETDSAPATGIQTSVADVEFGTFLSVRRVR